MIFEDSDTVNKEYKVGNDPFKPSLSINDDFPENDYDDGSGGATV